MSAKQATYMVLISDWLGSKSVAAMTPAEEGGYFRLCLMAADSEDGTLPDDDYELARLSRLGEAWYSKPDKRAKMTSGERIRECFIAADGRLRHAQVDADKERYAENKAKKKHAAEKRWSCKTDARAMQMHPPKHANAIPSSSSSSLTEYTHTAREESRNPEVPESFDGQVVARGLTAKLLGLYDAAGLAAGDPDRARYECEQVIGHSTDPVKTAGALAPSLERWIARWLSERAAGRSSYASHLQKWLKSGEWARTPALAAPSLPAAGLSKAQKIAADALAYLKAQDAERAQ